MKKIGFIGLGIMGKPMVTNLLKAGVDVTVCDLNSDAVEALVNKGAKAGTYETLANECDIIMTILPEAKIVQGILFGAGGLADKLKPGQIFCDMSSETPGESKFSHDKLAAKGVAFLDAPVSGGEPGAIAGTLAIMVGGEKEAFDECMPYFEILGSSAMYMGECGSGSVTKLANQIIVNLNIAAVSEALVFATKAGVDPYLVYKAIRSGLAGSQVLDDKAPMMCSRNFKPGGTIKVNHKDIKNALQTAHEIESPSPFTAQLFELQLSLKARGRIMDDHAGYVKYFEQLAGVEVFSDKVEK